MHEITLSSNPITYLAGYKYQQCIHSILIVKTKQNWLIFYTTILLLFCSYQILVKWVVLRQTDWKVWIIDFSATILTSQQWIQIKLATVLIYLSEYIGSLPHDPIDSPTLRLDQGRDRIGQFIIDVSTAAPQPQAGELNQMTVISPVAFLFRFEDMTSNNVSFKWTVRCTA